MDFVEGSSEDTSDVSLSGEIAPQDIWTDEETEGDDTEEDSLMDQGGLIPAAPYEIKESDSSIRAGSSPAGADIGQRCVRSSLGHTRMFRLRRDLDQLDSLYRQKQRELLMTREELKACQQQEAELVQQKDMVEREMEQHSEHDDTAALLRLRAQHERLCEELQGEKELESHVALTLKEQETDLCRMEVELGRVSGLREEVQQEIQHWEAQREQRAVGRLQREKEAMRKTQRRTEQDRRELEAKEKRQAEEHQKAIEESRSTRQRASVLLKETLSRVHKEKATRKLEHQEVKGKRTQAVLSLKASIAAVQENLQVKQERERLRALQQKEEEARLKERLQAEGADVTTYMVRQKRLEDFQRRREEFEEKQRANRIGIVSKLLLEETLVEKRKKQTAHLFPAPPMHPKASVQMKSRDQLLRSLQALSTDAKEEPARFVPRVCSPASDEDEEGRTSAGDSAGLPGMDSDDDNEAKRRAEESLVLPEFAGLWEQPHKGPKDLRDYAGASERFHSSTARQEAALSSPVKQHSGALQKKAQSGKEFKGCPFVSKPELITFKDFEVGKTYKKKITLTNITYSTNYCKLLGVSAELKDVISVHFESPGPMSPGMGCDFVATFKPTINKDLHGEIEFTSAAGSFAVPLKCTIKKCVLAVDCSIIDFGAHVVGETISRAITLTNRGALGTRFVLVPSDGSRLPLHPQSQTSLSTEGRPGTDSANSEGGSEGRDSDTRQDQTELAEVPENMDMLTGTQHMPTGPAHSGMEVEEPEEDGLYCNEITAGKVKEGEISPFGDMKLEILFTPTIPGEVKTDFHINFSDPSAPPIPITARGVATSIPVWVTQPNVDMKICMYDRLYQDSIIVQSRASTALRLTFDVCKELRRHMEVLPKTGFVQANSTFRSQLKFLPRPSLPKDAPEFFDSKTGVLEVPVAVHVAGQLRPVPFTVHAVVTSSNLEFDRTHVDLGHCTIHESVQSSVRLTNLSLLPQDFGFVGLPKFIDIQPNDGFGTLLPLETLEVDISFRPNKTGDFSFHLTCKSGINRSFRLRCKAVAVRPLLELSHNMVEFRATAVGDQSTALLHVLSPDTAGQDVPRLFHFDLAECPNISIVPTSGRLLPGQRCLIQVSFRPRLSDTQVKEEAVRMLCLAEELQVQERRRLENNKEPQPDTKRARKPVAGRAGAKADSKGKSSTSSSRTSLTPAEHSPFQPPKPQDILPSSEEYARAKASLLRSFPRSFSRFIIPCFVSNGDIADHSQGEALSYSTLHLELHCPAVRPCMVVISNNGRTALDFQQVAIGQKAVQRVTLQNISQRSLDLKSTLLDVCGPFSIMNALRPLEPGATHTIVLAFTPSQGRKYFETLEVRCAEMGLQLSLHGVGVQPTVTCSHEAGVMNFGYVLEKESASQVFTLQNASSLQVRFSVHQESLSPTKLQGLPEFLTPGGQSTVGTQNYSGLPVFIVSPIEGAIPPGKTQDITVTFQPDHESLYYSDGLRVELMNKQTVCSVELRGACRRCTMFLCGGEPLGVSKESLAHLPCSVHTGPPDCDRAPQPVLLTFRAVSHGDEVIPVVRELEVGSIRSVQPMAKKGVEFSWDGLPALHQTGFTIEPLSGTVEPGNRRVITVMWAPPTGLKPNEVVHTRARLTLKGDEIEVYSVHLMATAAEEP